MSLGISSQVPISKTCAACGCDVSSQRRVKDSQGRYFCEPCVARLAEKRERDNDPSTPADVPPPLFCEQCSGQFPEHLLKLAEDGRVLCRRCNVRAGGGNYWERLVAGLALAHLPQAERYAKLRWRFLFGGVVLHLLLPVMSLRLSMMGWLEIPFLFLALASLLAGAVLLNFGFAFFALQRNRSAAWCGLGYVCHLAFMFGCLGTAYWIIGAFTGAGLFILYLWPVLLIFPMKWFYSLADHGKTRAKRPVLDFDFVERAICSASLTLGIALVIMGLVGDGWIPKSRVEHRAPAVAEAQNEVTEDAARRTAQAHADSRRNGRQSRPQQQPPPVSYRVTVGDQTQDGVYGVNAPPPKTVISPVSTPPKPLLSSAKCQAWAKEFEDATANGDTKFLFQSFDSEGAARRAMTGIAVNDELMTKVQALVNELLKDAGDLGEQLIKKHPCKVLWTRQTGSEQTVMVRCLLKEGDVDYLRLTLAPDAAGNVRVVDLFQLSSGGEWGRTIRTVALPLVVSTDPVALRNLTPADRDIVNNAPLLGQIYRSATANRVRELPTLISQLPPSLQGDRYFSLLNVKASAEMGTLALEGAVQRHQRQFPDDPSLAFATFQRHVRAKDYVRVLEALFTLDEGVGGDPYIAGLRAAAYAGIGNVQEAKRHAQQALAKEPSLVQPHWILVYVALEQKDNAEVARLLTRLESELGETIPLLTEDHDFAGFTASSEYRNWAAGRKGKDQSLILNLGTGVNVQLVFIAPGEFQMGSPVSEPGRTSGEKQHKMTISQGYYLCISEVTQVQWRAVMGNNPSKVEGDDLPVNNVSWHDATAFCRTLSKQQGRVIRLPTEAEWEYACRAGTTTAFNFGDKLSTDLVNCAGNENPMAKQLVRGKPVAVMSLKPNGWGLYEMHGNVWEWCADRPGDGTNAALEVRDTIKPLRGGSFGDVARACRSASEFSAPSTHASNATGFRVLVEVPADKPVAAPAKR
jgi:formylglycine-generating enzyme required for sulfatase activity